MSALLDYDLNHFENKDGICEILAFIVQDFCQKLIRKPINAKKIPAFSRKNIYIYTHAHT